jgi:hypothetical protein
MLIAPIIAIFLNLNNFILFGLPLIVGLDGYLIQVVVSPFAPHGLGDQIWPVDQNFTVYCQGAPIWEVPVDAEQTGRDEMPRLREPQHLVDREYFFRVRHLNRPPSNTTGHRASGAHQCRRKVAGTLTLELKCRGCRLWNFKLHRASWLDETNKRSIGYAAHNRLLSAPAL